MSQSPIEQSLIDSVLDPNEGTHTRALQELQKRQIWAQHVKTVAPGLSSAIANAFEAQKQVRKLNAEYQALKIKDAVDQQMQSMKLDQTSKDAEYSLSLAKAKNMVADQERSLKAGYELRKLGADHNAFRQILGAQENTENTLRSTELARKIAELNGQIEDITQQGLQQRKQMAVSGMLSGQKPQDIARQQQRVILPNQAGSTTALESKGLLARVGAWFSDVFGV